MTAAVDDDYPPRRLITDEEWQQIKRSLEKVGVNADAVVVKLWPDFVFPTGEGTEIRQRMEWPLREALPLITEHCDVTEPDTVLLNDATPREAAKKQELAIRRCRDLIEWLDEPWNYNRSGISRLHVHAQVFQFPELTDLAFTAQVALMAFVHELERCRNELMAMGVSRGSHLRKTHIEFWKELERVWRANISKDVKWRTKHLASFLIACSRPFFPEETTDGAINAFTDRSAASSK